MDLKNWEKEVLENVLKEQGKKLVELEHRIRKLENQQELAYRYEEEEK